MSFNESEKKINLSSRQISAGWPKVGYDKGRDEVIGFYIKSEGATKKNTSFFEKKRLTDIFIHAMAIGKYAGITKEYDKKSDRKDTIDMEYIAGTPEYLWMMISIALVEAKKNDEDPLEIFEDPRNKILAVCERYANYGINLLINQDKEATSDNPFSGYERKFEQILDDMKE